MMYYIYILFNDDIKKYYIGYSSDPWKRLVEHNSGDKTTYTGKYANWELKGVFKVSEIESEAMRVENFIKKQKSKVFIEKLIDPTFKPEGKLAQLVSVPKLRD